MADQVFDGFIFEYRNGNRARLAKVTFSATPDGMSPLPTYNVDGDPAELSTDAEGYLNQFAADAEEGWLLAGAEAKFVQSITYRQKFREVLDMKGQFEQLGAEVAAAVQVAQASQAAAESSSMSPEQMAAQVRQTLVYDQSFTDALAEAISGGTGGGVVVSDTDFAAIITN